MNTIPTKLIAIISVIVLGVIGLTVLIGTYNSLVEKENGIIAVHEDMKNVHASVYNQLRSQGLAVEKYGELVINAMQVAMTGRYGQTGSQAAVQWIKEQNPAIDAKVMAKLQNAIEAGYNKFESTQRTKIDRLRIYDNTIESAVTGFLARNILGFPKKVTAEVRQTITTGATDEMMKTKQMETIDPFSKKSASAEAPSTK